jgi:hypothetical protein
MNKWNKLYCKYHPAVVKAKWVTGFLPHFQWWDDVQAELGELVKPNSLWFFHPIAFLGHLGRFESKLDLLLCKERLTVKEIADAREEINWLTAEERSFYYLQLQEKVHYRNQRNNQQTAYIADRMCNLTSLAMALEYLGIENPDTTMQFEDYLEKQREEKGYGARTTNQSWKKLSEDFDVTMKHIELNSSNQSILTSNLKPELEAGYGVVISVFSIASGKGHIVRLQNISDAGLIVDDPFGNINDFAQRESGGSGYTGTSNTRDSENGIGENNLWKWTDIDQTTIKYADVFIR